MREVRKYPELITRIEKVREMRLASRDAGTRKKAENPWLFRETNNPQQSLVIPRVSSEKRKYIPIGYINQDIIASDAVLTIPEANLYHFSILTSNVHMAWMRAVAGRLKSDYRYSAFIVYNTFPFPNLNESVKQKLHNSATKIFKARDLYKDWSMAELYDDLIMPPELRKAHQENDKVVMEAYGLEVGPTSETDAVAKLLEMYEQLLKKE